MKKYPKYKETEVKGIPSIPKDWVINKIKFVSKTIAGGTPDTKNVQFWENGTIPWLPSGKIHDCNIYEEDADTFITELGLKGSAAKLIPTNSILIALTGATCANIAHLHFSATANQSVVAMPGSKKIENRYLFYCLLGIREQILINKTGGAQSGINDGDIKNTQIPFPTLPEQHAIVRFLDYKTGQIDSFIANRQKQIELLKEQRNSIIDKTILYGLKDNVTFKEYDNIFVKKLPKQWKLSSVRRELMSQNIEQQDGNHGELHPVATDYVDNGIPFVLASDVNNFEVDLVRCKKIPERIAVNLRIGFSKTGDILLTHKGTIGRVGICDTKEYPYIILTPQVTYYRIKRDFLPKFIFYQFQSNVFNEQLKLLSGGGSTRDYVGIVAQRELKLIKPPIDEQIEIVQYIDKEIGKLDTLIFKYQKQIDLMQEYRTSLISQAVTGKIDVRDWQPKKAVAV